MKSCFALLAGTILFSSLAFATHNETLSERGTGKFEADFPTNGHLRIDVCPADVRVVGTDHEKIKVSYWSQKAEEIADVRVKLKRSDADAELDISGGPHNNLHVTIEIPKSSDLHFRMMAGELNIDGMTASKDVKLHFGDMNIEVGNVNDYSRVEASVNAGDLDAAPFAVSKGGLFRSFEHRGPGKYRLMAHVGAGNLSLK